MKRFIGALAISSLLWAAGCRDHAAEAFARAELLQQALLSEGAPPTDERFETVKRELEKVPPTSKRYRQAQVMLGSLRARAQVRVPLALSAKGGRPPELAAQLAQCARLAVAAGRDGGVSGEALVRLEACRHEAEVMELGIAHGDAPAHAEHRESATPSP